MQNRIWILGASDPEMTAIESLLRQCGERVVYAESAPGVRVHSGNSYRALWPSELGGGLSDTDLYLVECAVVYDPLISPIWGGTRSTYILDHHRPGDPGYGRPPADFFKSSSIGQVVITLARLGVCAWPLAGGADSGQAVWVDSGGVTWLPVCRQWLDKFGGKSPCSWAVVPREIVLTAAADHCLGAAYAGQCPGVDPDELLAFRAASRAAHQGRTIEAVLADIESAHAALLAAPVIELNPPAHTYDHDTAHSVCDGCNYESETVRDMRATHVPELPEAGTRYGIAYMARGLPLADGRNKIVVSGTPEVIRAFIAEWSPAQGLVDLYGDPARGFAGGYEVAT